jgi:acyl-coenzyme A synthetase/AMP-(fatty) acid ligase
VAGKGTCRILNHYGPTETTVGSCTFDVGTDVAAFDPRSVPIGRPIANTSAYVVDTRLDPVPPGVAGELFLGGAGVARGYIGQPEQTKERFVSDPFASRPGAKMYRTGDRVRMLGDGNIEFLGRADDQVKIRGFRVEPAEIESALATHPAVRQAAVVPISEEETVVRLVAYLLPTAAHAETGRPSVEELRAHLLTSLPDYMVPSDYAFLDTFPLTPSGKVDRIALRATTALEAAWEAAYVAPRDETEEGVARIWAELLGVERVGAFDDFFALGGNSLMATQVIMRVRRVFGDVPLQAMFIAPTVAGLAEAIKAESNGDR